MNVPLPTYSSSLQSVRSVDSLPRYDPSMEPPPRAIFERFSIPTRNSSLSSGFPYDPRVYTLITHDEWHLLSNDIVASAKLTFGEDLAAWTAGITTGTLTSPFLFVFGPVVGYYAGRSLHRQQVVKKARESLGREGDIRSVLQHWNEEKFRTRGFEVWLELPVDGGEIHENANTDEKKPKKQKRVEKKSSKRFRIFIIPNNAKMNQSLSQTENWASIIPVSLINILIVKSMSRGYIDLLPHQLRWGWLPKAIC